MNWKFSICLLIFFWFHGALGSLIDQIDGETGDLINKADPTISDQMKEMLKMTPEEWTKSQGLSGETHFVTTSDGYILRLDRIFSKRSNGKVILGMHGLECDSFNWILNQRNQSLGFLLADDGFDVWIGNNRGSRYSKNHNKLDPKHDSAFWDFGIDELALLDIPALVEYIKTETSVEKIDYFGHSEGTTQIMMILSEMPDFADNFRSVHFLAPVMSLQSSTSILVESFNLILPILEQFPSSEFLKEPEFIVAFNIAFCGLKSLTGRGCKFGLESINGKTSSYQRNTTQVPLYMEHFLKGASVRQFAHYGQMRVHDTFCKYDFGKFINMKRYGQRKPPCYNISNIKIPLTLYTSDNDAWGQPSDIDVLVGLLEASGNLGNVYNIPASAKFNHMDFVYTIHGDQFVYKFLLAEFNKNSTK